jgi:hypothetical protein
VSRETQEAFRAALAAWLACSPQMRSTIVVGLRDDARCLRISARNPDDPEHPVPTAADLEKAADDLSAANAKAKHGTPADTADRDAQRLVGDELADRFVLYVRATVRAQAASAAEAANMILALGLAIKTVTTRNKAELAAKYDRVSGDVHLVARAVAADAVYLWEWSLVHGFPAAARGGRAEPLPTRGVRAQAAHLRLTACSGLCEAVEARMSSL